MSKSSWKSEQSFPGGVNATKGDPKRGRKALELKNQKWADATSLEQGGFHIWSPEEYGVQDQTAHMGDDEKREFGLARYEEFLKKQWEELQARVAPNAPPYEEAPYEVVLKAIATYSRDDKVRSNFAHLLEHRPKVKASRLTDTGRSIKGAMGEMGAPGDLAGLVAKVLGGMRVVVPPGAGGGTPTITGGPTPAHGQGDASRARRLEDLRSWADGSGGAGGGASDARRGARSGAGRGARDFTMTTDGPGGSYSFGDVGITAIPAMDGVPDGTMYRHGNQVIIVGGGQGMSVSNSSDGLKINGEAVDTGSLPEAPDGVVTGMRSAQSDAAARAKDLIGDLRDGLDAAADALGGAGVHRAGGATVVTGIVNTGRNNEFTGNNVSTGHHVTQVNGVVVTGQGSTGHVQSVVGSHIDGVTQNNTTVTGTGNIVQSVVGSGDVTATQNVPGAGGPGGAGGSGAARGPRRPTSPGGSGSGGATVSTRSTTTGGAVTNSTTVTGDGAQVQATAAGRRTGSVSWNNGAVGSFPAGGVRRGTPRPQPTAQGPLGPVGMDSVRPNRIQQPGAAPAPGAVPAPGTGELDATDVGGADEGTDVGGPADGGTDAGRPEGGATRRPKFRRNSTGRKGATGLGGLGLGGLGPPRG